MPWCTPPSTEWLGYSSPDPISAFRCSRRCPVRHRFRFVPTRLVRAAAPAHGAQRRDRDRRRRRPFRKRRTIRTSMPVTSNSAFVSRQHRGTYSCTYSCSSVSSAAAPRERHGEPSRVERWAWSAIKPWRLASRRWPRSDYGRSRGSNRNGSRATMFRAPVFG